MAVTENTTHRKIRKVSKYKRERRVSILGNYRIDCKILVEYTMLPLEVREVQIFSPSKWSYPVCPNCGITMEREYQHFCDRCGQKLAWNDFANNHIKIRRAP